MVKGSFNYNFTLIIGVSGTFVTHLSATTDKLKYADDPGKAT